MEEELGYLLLYIAGFGFSDYIVKYYKLTGINYLLFYVFILILAIILLNKEKIKIIKSNVLNINKHE